MEVVVAEAVRFYGARRDRDGVPPTTLHSCSRSVVRIGMELSF